MIDVLCLNYTENLIFSKVSYQIIFYFIENLQNKNNVTNVTKLKNYLVLKKN